MNDLISRQAAIDGLNGNITVTGEANAKAVQEYIRSVSLKIHDLPSAQPEVLACGEGELSAQTENIRCKDCRFYHKEWDGTETHCYDEYWCEWVEPNEDDFCSLAERKTEKAENKLDT